MGETGIDKRVKEEVKGLYAMLRKVQNGQRTYFEERIVAELLKNQVFWDVALCRASVCRSFGRL
jgi:hypothetical protein